MNTFLKYIIYTNLVVAFSAGLLSAGFCFMQKIDLWWLYGLFSLFSTLAVYNGQRLFKSVEKKETEWLIWVTKHRLMLRVIVIVSVFISSIIFLYLDSRSTIIYVVFVVVSSLSMLYVVRIKGRNMRELPHVKIHLIALTWCSVLILFPLLNEKIEALKLDYFIAFYLFVLAVTIPFDIRDLKYDHEKQKTIPQLLGIRNSKVLSAVLLGVFFIGINGILPHLKLNYLFVSSMVVLLVLLLFMNEKRSDFYCAGLIDGAIGLVGLSFFLE